MFGLTFEKLLIIGVIAAFLIGPDKLPLYAGKLGDLVKRVREMTNGAKDRMRDEMGPEFNDVDWKKLDPRQYDPRRIIREALVDTPLAPPGAASAVGVGAGVGAAAAVGTAASVGAPSSSGAAPTLSRSPGVNQDSAYLQRKRRLEAAGLPAPFDAEAT